MKSIFKRLYISLCVVVVSAFAIFMLHLLGWFVTNKVFNAALYPSDYSDITFDTFFEYFITGIVYFGVLFCLYHLIYEWVKWLIHGK
jgi:hypothetical protein